MSLTFHLFRFFAGTSDDHAGTSTRKTFPIECFHLKLMQACSSTLHFNQPLAISLPLPPTAPSDPSAVASSTHIFSSRMQISRLLSLLECFRSQFLRTSTDVRYLVCSEVADRTRFIYIDDREAVSVELGWRISQWAENENTSFLLTYIRTYIHTYIHAHIHTILKPPVLMYVPWQHGRLVCSKPRQESNLTTYS